MERAQLHQLINELKDKGRDEKYGATGGRHPVRMDATWILTGLVHANRGKTIVELGTAYGFSTLFLLMGKEKGAKVFTVEFDKHAASEAQKTLRAAGYEKGEVEVFHGDCTEFLSRWPSDRVINVLFLDADKSQYGKWYKQARPFLRPGSLIIADNVLFKGEDVDCRAECQDLVDAVREDSDDMKILENDCGLLVAHFNPLLVGKAVKVGKGGSFVE